MRDRQANCRSTIPDTTCNKLLSVPRCKFAKSLTPNALDILNLTNAKAQLMTLVDRCVFDINPYASLGAFAKSPSCQIKAKTIKTFVSIFLKFDMTTLNG